MQQGNKASHSSCETRRKANTSTNNAVGVVPAKALYELGFGTVKKESYPPVVPMDPAPWMGVII
jgi:hypothetical protein